MLVGTVTPAAEPVRAPEAEVEALVAALTEAVEAEAEALVAGPMGAVEVPGAVQAAAVPRVAGAAAIASGKK